MNPVRILIVEDEPLIAEDIAFNLRDLGYTVSGIAHNYHQAIDKLKEQSVDFAILDINLEGEYTGIELAQVINEEYSIPFIFLTSYSDNDTIVQAKSVQPLGYLVKPIDEKDLLTTIEIALFNFNQKLEHSSSGSTKLNNTLFIRHNGAFEKIFVQDIVRAEAHDNYTFVFTSDKKYLLSNTLKLVEERLKPWDFVRIHRSHLINPDCITKIEDGSIYVADEPLPLSKKYKSGFYDRVNLL